MTTTKTRGGEMTEPIVVRVTMRVKSEIEDAADADGVTVAEWVRESCERRLVRIRSKARARARAFQLNGDG